MTVKTDLIVLGSGPGGYVAAIRAAQLGMTVKVIEKESLGGICLNWGCIPTKALLKSADVWNYIKNSEDYGFSVSQKSINFDDVIKRSRRVSSDMSKGVDFLFKKNNIIVVKGHGKIKNKNTVIVTKDNKISEHTATNIIIATGAKSKELPNIKIDNKHVIEYRKAMTLKKLPKSMVVVGAGAIGIEFAYFYNSLGADVTLVEYLDRLVPFEDAEISQYLYSNFKKAGIKIHTSSSVESVEIKNNKCYSLIKSQNKNFTLESEVVLSAVGISPNISNIGLEDLGIKTKNQRIVVDDFYKTNIDNIYAIGDVIPTPALAHVASAEGILCVEKIAGLNPEVLDYNNVPSCVYCQPEIASVGYTEEQAINAGYEIKVGKFPFIASGKANAAGSRSGFVKVIFDAKYGEWLGAHMIGMNVTDMIAEVVATRKLETTAHEIIKSVHPHPTISEAIVEAVAQAYGECIHI